MYYTYILFSEKDKRLYIGFTPNLRSRLKSHSSGYVHSTKDRRPLKLIYYEAYLNSSEARKREIYLKGGDGRSQIKIQLAKTLRNLGYNYLK